MEVEIAYSGADLDCELSAVITTQLLFQGLKFDTLQPRDPCIRECCTFNKFLANACNKSTIIINYFSQFKENIPTVLVEIKKVKKKL